MCVCVCVAKLTCKPDAVAVPNDDRLAVPLRPPRQATALPVAFIECPARAPANASILFGNA